MENSKFQNPKSKIKLGIFDLTDCEGCELQFLSAKSEIEKILTQVDICECRLLNDEATGDRLDIALVEGTPLNKPDIDKLYEIREKSDKLIAFGTCAATGGIASGLSAKKRLKYAKKIYKSSYKLKVPEVLPISHYVKVDLIIPGCPVDPIMTAQLLYNAINTGWLELKNYPVCQECKANGNTCLLVDGKPCLGPITTAGCNSTCPNSGFGCLGCLGLWNEANIEQFFRVLNDKKFSKERIEQLISFYLKNDEAIIRSLRSFHG